MSSCGVESECTGIATGNTLPNIDLDDFENTLRVNTLSCFIACKHASAAMQTTRSAEQMPGSIILTASVAGLRSGAGSSDYSYVATNLLHNCSARVADEVQGKQGCVSDSSR